MYLREKKRVLYSEKRGRDKAGKVAKAIVEFHELRFGRSLEGDLIQYNRDL